MTYQSFFKMVTLGLHTVLSLCGHLSIGLCTVSIGKSATAFTRGASSYKPCPQACPQLVVQQVEVRAAGRPITQSNEVRNICSEPVLGSLPCGRVWSTAESSNVQFLTKCCSKASQWAPTMVFLYTLADVFTPFSQKWSLMVPSYATPHQTMTEAG